MRTFKQPVFIGSGWGIDLQFTGNRPGDTATIVFGRPNSDERSVLGPLSIPMSGFVEVRVDGDITRQWVPTRYDWEIIFTRDGGSGILSGLPGLNVKVPLLEPPVDNDPLFGMNQVPLELSLTLGQYPEIGVELVAGLKGADGDGGADYDEMADLALVFENGLI